MISQTPFRSAETLETAHGRPRAARGRTLRTLALLIVLALCVLYWFDDGPFARFEKAPSVQDASALGARKKLVDLRPWETAQALAQLTLTPEEAANARQAEHLADHEVDQAFASALRQANTQRRALTGTALRLSQRVTELQQLAQQDDQRVQELTAEANVRGSQKRAPSNASAGPADLEIAKAQSALDHDELADAQQDLARASKDERTEIQQELAAHEAQMRQYDSQEQSGGGLTLVAADQQRTLAALLREWLRERRRAPLVQQAGEEAAADARALAAQHDALEAQANAQDSAGNGPSAPATSSDDRLASIRRRSDQRQLLSIYDDRIETEQQLAGVYAKWSSQLALQRKLLLRLILRSLALLGAIIIAVVLVDGLMRHWMERPGLDRGRIQTLRTLLRVGVQALGLGLMLLVTFGTPRQMPTIIGLATAGLTVVLQDFILAFFGWFVLMGRNGIRVGDSVEVNGVGGEVVAIGLFRTTLLETGNWTDNGHPTGRRVAFTNKFAISGQYFNFSTAGQWMWDEITLAVPAGEETYAVIDQIHQAVLRETERDARGAEREWKRAGRQAALSRFTPSVTVNLRPAGSGIDLVLRYVTRAPKRFEVRNRLYQCVVDVLHGPKPLSAGRPSRLREEASEVESTYR